MTVAEVRDHIETPIPDMALQRILDDAENELEYRFGSAADNQTERFFPQGLTRFVYPSRRVDSIQEITEITDGPLGRTETVLSANDYQLTFNSQRIDRLPQGDHSRTNWGDEVVVVYTPYDDTLERDRIVIDLVRLALSYGGADSESLPDYSYRRDRSYQDEREEILKGYRGRWWA